MVTFQRTIRRVLRGDAGAAHRPRPIGAGPGARPERLGRGPIDRCLPDRNRDTSHEPPGNRDCKPEADHRRPATLAELGVERGHRRRPLVSGIAQRDPRQEQPHRLRQEHWRWVQSARSIAALSGACPPRRKRRGPARGTALKLPSRAPAFTPRTERSRRAVMVSCSGSGFPGSGMR